MTNAAATEPQIEPYKLSKLFPSYLEYVGNPIFLTTVVNACNVATQLAARVQKVFQVWCMKNKLNTKLLNWTSLIQDLQRIKQLSNEIPLSFVSRLPTHGFQMFAFINKQNLTQELKN